MSIKLKVENQMDPGRSWEVVLPEPVATIGRQEDCAVILNDPAKHVSRVHATIRLMDGKYYLVVSSRINPVLLDGIACLPDASTILKHGSQIVMRPFKLTVSMEPSARAPAADYSKLGPTPSTTAGMPSRLARSLEQRAATSVSRIRPSAVAAQARSPAKPAASPAGKPVASPPPKPVASPPPKPVASMAPRPGSVPDNPAGGRTLRPSAPAGRTEAPSMLSLMETNLGPLRQQVDDSIPETELGAFLKGLGANDLDIFPMDPLVYFERVGRLARGFAAGLVSLVMARAEVKRQLNTMDWVTPDAKRNPLKLRVDVTEAVYYLFDPASDTSRDFMAPQDAVEHILNELVVHEVAVVAGIRAAVEGAIRRFDPKVLEEELEKTGGMTLNRKARLWDLYQEHYQRMEVQMAENLNRLFQTDFLGAYAEEVRLSNKS